MWRRFQDNELKHFPVFLHRRDIVLQFENGKEPKGVDVETLWCAPPNALYASIVFEPVERRRKEAKTFQRPLRNRLDQLFCLKKRQDS